MARMLYGQSLPASMVSHGSSTVISSLMVIEYRLVEMDCRNRGVAVRRGLSAKPGLRELREGKTTTALFLYAFAVPYQA